MLNFILTALLLIPNLTPFKLIRNIVDLSNRHQKINTPELVEINLLNEKLFALLKSKKKNYKKIKKIKCKLAMEYQNINEFKKSKKYMENCRKLGKNFKEIYDFLKIRENFYLNEKNLPYKINKFLKKYENSPFKNEVTLFKLRYYFKHNYYKSAYYGYLKYKKENKISHEKKLFTDYIIRYSFYKIAKPEDKFLAMLDILQDKNFYTKYEISEIKQKIESFNSDKIKKTIKNYLKNKKYGKINKLMNLMLKYKKNILKKIINEGEIKKLFPPNKKFSLDIITYKLNKNKNNFEKNEEFLNNILKKKQNKNQKLTLLIMKIYLYKKNKKTEKQIETYKEIVKLNISKRKKAYFTLKAAVYSMETNPLEAIKLLNTIIKKYRCCKREYTSALFLLFKYYRNKLIINKNTENTLKYLKETEKKMQKTYLKPIAYYFKYKDNRANKEEKEKIKKYFSRKPYNFYSLLISQKTIKEKDSYKHWEKITRYSKIPKPSISAPYKKVHAINRLNRIFKDHKIFPEIKIIKSLEYLKEEKLQEKVMINFYHRLVRLNKLKNRKSLNEYDQKALQILKNTNKNYYLHILNYFISANNYQYSYLLLHRHLNSLATNKIYRYYHHPFPYYEIIDREAKKFDINPLVITSIMETESIFNPAAYSLAGAIGLMQIMPQTGKAIAKALGIKNYNLYLPSDNIKFGTYYLSQLLKRFKYQLPFSAASYNGGPHNMKRWLQKNKNKKLELDEMINEIAFKESRNYAKKIIRLFVSYRKIYLGKDTLIPLKVYYNDTKTIDF